jgi:hypothetical protein
VVKNENSPLSSSSDIPPFSSSTSSSAYDLFSSIKISSDKIVSPSSSNPTSSVVKNESSPLSSSSDIPSFSSSASPYDVFKLKVHK